MNLLDYFDKNEPRYLHIQGVKSLMQKMVKHLGIDDNLAEQYLLSAELHDIGYSQKLNSVGFHPYDGYVFCKDNDINDLVSKAVLFHSGAYIQVLINNLTDFNQIYLEKAKSLTEEEMELIDILTFCDNHADGRGKFVSLDDRIQDIENRYKGKTSPIHSFYCNVLYYKNLDKKYLYLLK